MEPLSAAIMAGGSLLGGWMGQQSTDRMAQKQFKWNKKLAKIQLDETIQRRVADASKAGIHPLYALGASSAGVSGSQFIPGQSPMGSAVKDATAAIARAMDKPTALEQAQTDLLTAQAKEINQRVQQTAPAGPPQPAETFPATEGPYKPPHIPAKAITEYGPQTNPDTAIGIEEVLGVWVDRALHWKPNTKEFNDIVFGAWKRLGTRAFNEFQRRLEAHTGRKLKKPTGRKPSKQPYRYGGM